MAKFTPETARKAQQARADKRAARLRASLEQDLNDPAYVARLKDSMAQAERGETTPWREAGAADLLSGAGLPQADVVVPPHPDTPPTIDVIAPREDPAAAAPGTTVEVATSPFTPEVAEMLTKVAFDLAGAATGRPQIWKADDEEIRPIAPLIAHQLARIPIVRAIGPDNTELTIVVAGLGVMVTKRLNQHADAVQQERQAKIHQLRTGERPRPRDVAPPPITAEPEPGSESEAGALLSFRGI